MWKIGNVEIKNPIISASLIRSLFKENKDKTPEELDKLCTCGNRAFNRRLIKIHLDKT